MLHSCLRGGGKEWDSLFYLQLGKGNGETLPWVTVCQVLSSWLPPKAWRELFRGGRVYSIFQFKRIIPREWRIHGRTHGSCRSKYRGQIFTLPWYLGGSRDDPRRSLHTMNTNDDMVNEKYVMCRGDFKNVRVSVLLPLNTLLFMLKDE